MFGLMLTLCGLVLGAAAALGTITGLFLGIPAAGFVLSPVIRAACRRAGIEAEPTVASDRVLELEASLCAGLGMGLGVGVTVALVGLVALEPRAPLAAVASGLIAGLVFGAAWRIGYRQRSAAPALLLTATLSATAAAWAGG